MLDKFFNNIKGFCEKVFSKEVNKEIAKRCKKITDDKKKIIIKEVAKAKKTGETLGKAFAKIAADFKVSAKTIERIWYTRKK